MSMESSDALPVGVESTGNFWRDRPRWSASLIETRLRALMIAATLLVIPDLIMEEQPLRTSWRLAAQIGDWLIWLVLRVARGFELLSKLLTLEGLKYVAALVVFLVVGGGTVFADVESHAGTHISTWTGIWWAIGTVSTEGTHIEAATDAGRAIAIVLMLTGMGAFGILTAAISQRFIASRAIPRAEALNQGEVAILARLDEIASRLDGLEATRPWPVEPQADVRQRITDTGPGPDLLTNITREPSR